MARSFLQQSTRKIFLYAAKHIWRDSKFAVVVSVHGSRVQFWSIAGIIHLVPPFLSSG